MSLAATVLLIVVSALFRGGSAASEKRPIWDRLEAAETRLQKGPNSVGGGGASLWLPASPAKIVDAPPVSTRGGGES